MLYLHETFFFFFCFILFFELLSIFVAVSKYSMPLRLLSGTMHGIFALLYGTNIRQDLGR